MTIYLSFISIFGMFEQQYLTRIQDLHIPLRKAIKANGIKQSHIAPQVDTDETTLSAYLKGKRYMHVERIDRLIRVLGYELRLVKKGEK